MNLHGLIMNLPCDTPGFGRTTTKHYKEGHCDARHAAAEMALAADAEIESLRAFSRAVLECWPDGDVDGGMLQDLAVQHGLLEPQTKTAPCREEGCRCAEYYASDEWVDGITCYRRTALVLGA